MPPRRRLGITRAAARARRNETPPVEEQEPTADTPDQNNAQSPSDSLQQEADADGDTGPASTPVHYSDHVEEPSNPPTPQAPVSTGRRRRPGRPPRNARPDFSRTPDPAVEDGSETGTPARRGRGRGPGTRGEGRGRGRGRGRGSAARGPAQITRVPIDKEGTMMDVIDDEVAMPEDPEGETKVDKSGNLQGGREYRVRTFTILDRGDRLYMLSTEPARCTGFRDSYLFFNKHLTLFKIIINDEEKRDLIERDLIPHSYKGRAIGVVTARSVFREFGARIVVGGRKILDDYDVQGARARGDAEGELVDPNDKIPAPGETYNRNQYVAWHGASSVYHTNAPSVPLPLGVKPIAGKRKANITSANWMYEHAMAASRFNSFLTHARRWTNNGVYEPHTNMMHYPASTQPTHVRWQVVLPDSSTSVSPKIQNQYVVNGHRSAKPLANGTILSHSLNGTNSTTLADHDTTSHSENFPKLTDAVERNFFIVDTHFNTPAQSQFAFQENSHGFQTSKMRFRRNR